MVAKRFCLVLAAASVLSFPSLGLRANVVEFQAFDLPDAAVGEDLWQYRYRLREALPQFHSFDVSFPSDSYAQLEVSPSAPNADWFVATVPIDASLPADGFYTATAT